MRAVLAAAVAVALTAASCTSTTVTTKAQPATGTGAGSSRVTSASPKATPTVAHVGSTIKLEGQAQGDLLSVTLVKIANTTTATDGFSKPATGMRYFAAQFKVANTGSGAYADSPSNGAKAIDAEGQQFQATLVSSIAAGPQLPAETKVTSGGFALGWLVFEVPAAAKVASVQFSLSSGFGATGQWQVA